MRTRSCTWAAPRAESSDIQRVEWKAEKKVWTKVVRMDTRLAASWVLNLAAELADAKGVKRAEK